MGALSSGFPASSVEIILVSGGASGAPRRPHALTDMASTSMIAKDSVGLKNLVIRTKVTANLHVRRNATVWQLLFAKRSGKSNAPHAMRTADQ